ncbi:flagellar biosynthesis/type III secretory pathway chaperone [Anoxybacillus calidus]|uniref:Flagellar biosynthesis/type III secretory pathway chaperone n=1 Tax=[Anoxybacillus] calidus TaxID=575178 RepID=A0A7W0BVA0_9BACL|nr:flagellar protein FlgN [Anoxybacillus calidus]MBA2871315.1 flagellar biosynthesis/type III secretory pathway chaperone [Anoxybacillus calidus]
MSVKLLIELLEKHVKLHKGLLELANQKTEVLKKGDMEALSGIMKQEQKYIAAINQVERERMHVVEAMVNTAGKHEHERTLTTCIELVEESERSVLERLKDELSAVVSELKNINLLNQQLTQQSLQFVNMTLDMIMPQPQEVNYGIPNAATTPQYENSRSIFDSKA